MTKVVAAGEVAWDEILEDIQRNDEVVILQDGRAVARVVPIPVPNVRMTSRSCGSPLASSVTSWSRSGMSVDPR